MSAATIYGAPVWIVGSVISWEAEINTLDKSTESENATS
jgi:hypothetical protein